jgi:hypothetical protein
LAVKDADGGQAVKGIINLMSAQRFDTLMVGDPWGPVGTAGKELADLISII